MQPSKLQIQESRGPLASYVGRGVDIIGGDTIDLVFPDDDAGFAWGGRWEGRWRSGRGGTALTLSEAESESPVVGGDSGAMDALAVRFRRSFSS